MKRASPTAIWRPLLAAALLALATEINPESVSLTTYFPAATGMYQQMLTTNKTVMTATQGNLGVGTTAPGSRVHVVAGGGVSATDGGMFRALGFGNPTDAFTAIQDLRMGHLAGDAAMEVLGTGNGGVYRDMAFRTGGADRINILGGSARVGYVGVGAPAPEAMLQVGAIGSAGGILKVGQGQGSCVVVGATGGGITCPAGNYATSASGLYANRVHLGYRPTTQNPPVDFLCCACPAGGCSF